MKIIDIEVSIRYANTFTEMVNDSGIDDRCEIEEIGTTMYRCKAQDDYDAEDIISDIKYHAELYGIPEDEVDFEIKNSRY
jgi:hypothetical protein